MPKSLAYRNLHWLWLSVLTVLLDRGSKYLASHHLLLGQSKKILPFFNFTLAYNTGAAFSFLHTAGGWQRWFFVGLAVVVTVVFIVWLLRMRERNILLAAGLAFVLGGAFGNAYDRLIYGYVVDFFDFHYQAWHFPVFNVADSAIFIGAVFIIIDSLRNRRENTNGGIAHD